MRVRRFAPWFLLGCLVLTASCGKDEDVPTSGAVGHVVVVKGEVSAQRVNQQARMVRVDDTVFADDTIVTGETASVGILLTHNGALWELGENSERRIDKGIAFRARRRGAAPLDQKEAVATSAAGRGTTREAADSLGTVLREKEEEEGGSAEELAGAAVDSPRNEAPTKSTTQDLSGKRNGGARGSSKPKQPRSSSQAPPKNSASGTTYGGTGPGSGPGLGSLETRSAPIEDPVSPRDEAVANSDEDDADEPEPEPVAPAPKAEKAKKESPKSLQIAFVESKARLCHETHGGKGVISYNLQANGTFTVSSSQRSLRPLTTCLKKALGARTPPKNMTIQTSLRF